MRRGIGLVSLAVVAVLCLAAPVRAEEVCTRNADPNPAAHPGVVLGPATKCVRTDDGSVAPAGSAGARTDEPREFPWAPIAASAALLSVSGASALQRRRQSVRRQPTARTA